MVVVLISIWLNGRWLMVDGLWSVVDGWLVGGGFVLCLVFSRFADPPSII